MRRGHWGRATGDAADHSASAPSSPFPVPSLHGRCAARRSSGGGGSRRRRRPQRRPRSAPLLRSSAPRLLSSAPPRGPLLRGTAHAPRRQHRSHGSSSSSSSSRYALPPSLRAGLPQGQPCCSGPTLGRHPFFPCPCGRRPFRPTPAHCSLFLPALPLPLPLPLPVPLLCRRQGADGQQHQRPRPRRTVRRPRGARHPSREVQGGTQRLSLPSPGAGAGRP